jgi:hypothetical protein
LTAKQLYKKKYQWFEPLADNYYPIISKAEKLAEMSELKHFTWSNIAAFADVDRISASYMGGGSGDWKYVSEGADEYLLVTVGGEPYWGDAIGQIPFAVDTYRECLYNTHNPTEAIVRTLVIGMAYGDGDIMNPKKDESNTYDNLMILRGALYAYHKYKESYVTTDNFKGWVRYKDKDYSPTKLGTKISQHYKDKYLSHLKSNEE